jgi:hypothetical protein
MPGGLKVSLQCGRAVSFENGVGKQELPSFFEITVDRQASELFLHNH